MNTKCGLCGRFLNIEADPLSGDCGGDCWGCIGQIEADMGGDPATNVSIGFVAEEIIAGWREHDGSPKPQNELLLFVAASSRK